LQFRDDELALPSGDEKLRVVDDLKDAVRLPNRNESVPSNDINYRTVRNAGIEPTGDIDGIQARAYLKGFAEH
jgi:hypothetical protein